MARGGSCSSENHVPPADQAASSVDPRQTARERADSIIAGSYTSASALANTGSLLRRQPSHTLLDENSHADETSAILRDGQPYQSYDSVPGSAPMSTRSKRSAYGRRSPSLASSAMDGRVADRADADETNGYPDEDQALDWNGNGEQAKGPPSFWEKSVAPFRSIELENKGSVARDHLALERTFLAWLRTSLAFASIGVAITQLFRLNTSLSSPDSNLAPGQLRRLSQPLGASFLVISIVILMLGYRRYVNAQKWIIEGKFPASRGTIMVVVLVALSIMILSLAVVISIQPRSR